MLNWNGFTKSLATACRGSGKLLFVIAIALAWPATPVSAQWRSEIRPRDGDQAIKHNERPEPQVFQGALWGVDTKSKFGATVTLSCGPFENMNDPGSFAEGQLGLRVLSSQHKPNWRVRIATDRTNMAGGKKRATVMAESEDKGSGVLELIVTFLGADVLDLVEGDYSTTVTGTITAH